MSATTPSRTLTDEQAQLLHDIVIEILEVGPDELTDTSRFVEDHDADSLLAIEILARIEQDLGVIIPQEQLTGMVHLAAVREAVARNMAGAHQ